jgi:hypothetical protein
MKRFFLFLATNIAILICVWAAGAWSESVEPKTGGGADDPSAASTDAKLQKPHAEDKAKADAEALTAAWIALRGARDTIHERVLADQIDAIRKPAQSLPGLAQALLKHDQALPEGKRAGLETMVESVAVFSRRLGHATKDHDKKRILRILFQLDIGLHRIQSLLPAEAMASVAPSEQPPAYFPDGLPPSEK